MTQPTWKSPQVNVQRIRIVGQLDGLVASTRRFTLLHDSGDKIDGRFLERQADLMRELWQKRVLVLGTAFYQKPGRPPRLVAEAVREAKNESAIFSRMPTPPHAPLDRAKLRQPQGPCSGMAAILGQWPGDESEEEIRAALDKLS